ncbi:MAG TPA: HAMP domain-containing sensor histidine kinase [Gemmataceae bacterium]|jgi:signal transduction histidine kinase
MKHWLRGKPAGLIGFVGIAALVAGGLGWATAAALRLEGEQLAQRAESERANLLRLALWRLDSRISPLLAREESRPFNHYSAVYPTPLALNNAGRNWSAGSVLEPSPLLSTELPPWMLLHFQTDSTSGWESPQVLSPKLNRLLRATLTLSNVTPERQRLLAELKQDLPVAYLLKEAGERTQPATVRDTTMLLAQNALNNSVNSSGRSGFTPPNQNPDMPSTQTAQAVNSNYTNSQMLTQEYNTRLDQQNKLRNEGKVPQRVQKDLANFIDNGAIWFAPQTAAHLAGAEVLVNLSPMVPVWLETPAGKEHLVLFRLVRIEKTTICQGIVLDGAAFQEMLAREVIDLFPEAKLLPMREAEPSQPERTMTALPFLLDPGPSTVAVPDPGWTPLRVGLTLAWLAALIALLAVGLGGWSLWNLSERRIRFVSAVTHELRTPLTTLRLYLDMLVNGLVRDDRQRGEYLHTLHAETDRLNRLVANVLDFSRLENQRPRLNRAPVSVADLLEQVRCTWAGRCQDAEKELIVENALAADASLRTDRELLQQVLGNLIDNACKYSRSAEDRRLWVRTRGDGDRLVFEIVDRGPGVPVKDRRLIFRAFRRGCGTDETAGGVGLGLALARRWTQLLGGRLTLQSGAEGCGACFRVELPLAG